MANLLQKASIVLTPTAYNNGEALCIKPDDASGDFQFSRNSAATRVNAQGLVENVQILSSNLVQNPSFSEEGVQEVSNGSFSQEGSELVVGGNFSNPSNWTKQASWSISGGAANYDFLSDAKYIRQTLLSGGFVAGKTYKINFEITSGTAYMNVNSNGGGLISLNTYSVGSYSIYVTASASGSDLLIYGRNTSGTAFSIDNVSVREVAQNWTLGTGWSIGEDKAVATNAPSDERLQQNNVFTVGKTYKITYEITELTQGFFKVYVGGTFLTSQFSVGVYTEYKTIPSNSVFYVKSSGTTSGSITNISVKEVGQNWTLGSSWSISNGSAYTDGSGQDYISQNVGLITGKKYNLSFDISNRVGTDGCTVIFGGSTFSGNAFANGTQTFQAVANGGIELRIYGFNGNTYNLDNISVIEITEDTNLPRINYEGFSYQDALGSELVTNGSFSSDTAWNKNGTVTISGGTANFNNSASGNNVEQAVTLPSGKQYIATYEITSITEGKFSIYVGGVLSGNQNNQVGVYTEVFTSIGNNVVYVRARGTTTGSIDNVSVKEYLGQEVVPDSGCGSWLFEPQSTNLITYSEDFSQWTTSNSTEIANNAISPSGGMNAYKLYPNSSGNYRNLTTGGQILGLNTFSIFAKAGELQHLVLIDYDGGGAGIDFNLSTGVATDVSTSGFDSFDMVDYGNGWYRCIATATDGFSYWILSDNGGVSVTANGTDGLYIWGAQTEQQSYATSYIPTSGSTVTRNQDLCTNGGSLASINSTEGTLYFEGAALFSGSNAQISLSDGTNDNVVILRFDLNPVVFTIFLRGNTGTYAIKTISGVTQTDNNKIALVWDITNFRIWLNGVEAGTIATNDLPVGLDTLNFTDSNSSSSPFFGKTKALAVWKEALSDEELTELTTI